VKFVTDQVDQAWHQNALEQRGMVPGEYAEHVNRITRVRLPALRVPFKNWEDAQQAETDERAALARSNRRTRRRLLPVTLVTPVLAVCGIVFVNLAGSHFGLSASGRTLLTIGLALGGLLTLGIRVGVWILARRAQGSRVNRASLVLKDQFRTLVTNLILEPAVTASLAIVWRDSAADLMRIQDGPELSAKADISNVVSTEAHSRLTIALNRRNGAAVGVAGPRGSGKTELARAFTELRPRRGHAQAARPPAAPGRRHDGGNHQPGR
jgi:hypothetical protein